MIFLDYIAGPHVMSKVLIRGNQKNQRDEREFESAHCWS